jgi:hypothetical protein
MFAPIVKEKISKYLRLEDMEEQLALSDIRKVHMSDKKDGFYVALYNDGCSIRVRSSGGHIFKYCLGLEAIPGLPTGVELRAELVLEKKNAMSSYQNFLDTNAFFSHSYLPANAENPFLDMRDLTEWNNCDERRVPCNIMLHVHGMVQHNNKLNTELVARYLEGADKNIKQIPWTLVTSVQQAKQRLKAVFEANQEGLIFFVQKLEPALGCGKSDADSRSCSPEPSSGSSRTVVGSEWIKGKIRTSCTGTVVMVGREGGRVLYTVRLDQRPTDIAEVKVRLGNTFGFDGNDKVCVDIIPKSYHDPKARHVIGMGVVGASSKRKRE